ncbi:MAG: DUF1194 domain-containing protein [Pseudomonadota bacterium]
MTALRHILFPVIAVCAFCAAAAQASCRQALALGLDVSGSVDEREYRLQTDGLAEALRDPEVQAAFLALPSLPVRLMIFEWSGRTDQRVIIPWTDIKDTDELWRIADILNGMGKAGSQDGGTAISSAMIFGARSLQAQSDCLQWTLDLSGDGPGNTGLHPRDVKGAVLDGVTINGLVLLPFSRANTSKNLTNVKTLEDYYRSFVLRGPGSFTEKAGSFAEFGSAMRRKLIRELQLPNLSLDLGPTTANRGPGAKDARRNQ